MTTDSLPSQLPPKGTVLAFDYGLKRTGVAMGELELNVAYPLSTLHADSQGKLFEEIAVIIKEWQPVALIVGLPTFLDGVEHEMTGRCKRFARQLEGRYRITTILVDERLSSMAASDVLREAGVSAKKQKALLDQVAAQQILQTFFDEQGHVST